MHLAPQTIQRIPKAIENIYKIQIFNRKQNKMEEEQTPLQLNVRS